MTNLYDIAYNLEKEIRKSPELIELVALQQEITADETANELLQSFRGIQMKFQTMQMMGQEIPEEEMEMAEETLSVAQQNEKIVKLLEVEQRVSMMVNDITKIIMKPFEELYGADE